MSKDFEENKRNDIFKNLFKDYFNKIVPNEVLTIPFEQNKTWDEQVKPYKYLESECLIKIKGEFNGTEISLNTTINPPKCIGVIINDENYKLLKTILNK